MAFPVVPLIVVGAIGGFMYLFAKRDEELYETGELPEGCPPIDDPDSLAQWAEYEFLPAMRSRLASSHPPIEGYDLASQQTWLDDLVASALADVAPECVPEMGAYQVVHKACWCATASFVVMTYEDVIDAAGLEVWEQCGSVTPKEQLALARTPFGRRVANAIAATTRGQHAMAQCKTHEDCIWSDYKCKDGECVPREGDVSWGVGRRRYPTAMEMRSGRGRPRSGCMSDKDCGIMETCSAGRCVPDLKDPFDRPGSGGGGSVAPKGKPCRDIRDCPTGQNCVDGRCRTQPDLKDPFGYKRGPQASRSRRYPTAMEMRSARRGRPRKGGTGGPGSNPPRMRG